MKKFYDMHMHAFDLSHPNLLAFIKRDGLLDADQLTDVFCKKITSGLVGKLFLGKLFAPKKVRKEIHKIIVGLIQKQEPKLLNTLSIFENPIEYQFLLLDFFLRNKEPLVHEDNKLHLFNQTFDKIVLCPLLIDFGKKGIDFHVNNSSDEVFYNESPKKPIRKQVIDILNAINIYYTHTLYRNKNGQLKIKEDKGEKLFEIYPFMGLNPANYTMKKLQRLFDKYFIGYENDTKENRQKKLKNNLGKFENNIDSEHKLPYFFSGIKVYPPLGFNPWPEGERNIEELEKVKYMYAQCVKKNLPIVTHCSGGGFSVHEKQVSRNLTNPSLAWSKVLQEFPELKLCFAHFGSLLEDGKMIRKWRDCIIHLTKHYPNVYADFSCSQGKDYYTKLELDLENPEQQHLQEKILFGTDFSVNLFANTDERSYNGYLKRFGQDPAIAVERKLKFCNSNTERFLYKPIHSKILNPQE